MAKRSDGEARFSLLDQVPLGVCVLSRGLVVRFWNACLASWTGVEPQEIVDRDLSERFPHLREPRYLLRLEPIFEGGPPTIFSSQLHRHVIPAPLPDGQLRIQHTVVTAIPRSTGGGNDGGFDALLSIQDVTDLTRRLEERKRAEDERRQMEARVQHAQKLESLGFLAGGIAHDFNNLLVGILGNADLALRQLGDDFAARGQLEAVVRAAQRAADLADQMLAYSGKGKFVTRTIDLSESVRDAVELIRAAISKKARLDYRLATALPAIEADPTQVRQVVMNLVTNASDALGEQSGTVTIVTGERDCDGAYLRDSYLKEDLPAGRYVYLEVSDTGRGMDAATLARIFDPFFTTKFAGRGLGLAAVLGIVRGHRGALKIRSRPGGGSSFRVLFPSSDQPVDLPSAAAPEESAAWVSQDTVLVVDDERLVRDLAQGVLEQAGLTVLTAGDGREGLDIFRRHAEHISVVVLDLTMPELSGEETYEKLRKIRPDVRVVLTSGYTEQAADPSLGNPGPVGFIKKPYLPADLIAMVREALGETPT